MEETKAQHTPGPWTAQILHADGVIIIRGDRYEIATPEYDVCAFLGRSAPIRKKADAFLIATAPELLEACRAVLASAGAECLPGAMTKILRDLIAKAEGE